MAAGYFVKDKAQLSIVPQTVETGPQGTTARDRVFEVIRSRRLVIGFDYISKVSQPFAIHVDPPISVEEGDYITGKRDTMPSAQERTGIWFGQVQFLTQTSKMGCYSWNLPAGPPKLNGTCPSAALGFMYSTAEDAQRQGGNVLDEPLHGRAGAKTAYRLDPETQPIHYDTFICNGCYALKNNYKNGNQIAFMVIRLALVQTLLGGKGTRAVQGVYWVDGEAWHRARVAGAKPKEAVRAAFQAGDAQELASGGIDGVRTLAGLFQTAILAADAHSTAERTGKMSFAHTAKEYASVRAFYEKKIREAMRGGATDPLAKGREKTEKAYAWAVPEPGFFRIHDSGDFFSSGYWEAWRMAMVALPNHRFWAPNRTWAHRSPTVQHDEIPENLAMRPSALHFDDPPPTQALLKRIHLPIYQKGKGHGLAAGSGSGDPKVMAPVTGTPFHAFFSAPDEPFWECPAYAYWTSGGGAVFGTETAPAGGTCSLARGPNNEKGCRACWGGKKGEYAHVGVVYHKH